MADERSGAARLAIRVLRWGAIAYGLMLVSAFIGARRLVFPAPTTDAGPLAVGARRVELVADDGVAVHAIVFDPPDAEAPVVVQFHGNGEVVGWNQAIGAELRSLGCGAVLVEYRGYGASAGARPSEPGLYADAAAVIRWLSGEGIARERTALWGFSLGTGVAAEMAARGFASRLVLQAPFTSVPDVAARRVPFLPVRLLLRDRFDTLAKTSRIAVPTLVIHGDADPVVPFEMGERVARAIPAARFVAVPHGGHDYEYGRGRWIYRVIADFIRS